MKDILDSLNRNLIFKSMKTAFFLAPIVLLTDRFYVNRHGSYHLDLHPQAIFSFIFSHQFVPVFLFFFILFSISLFLETVLLPGLMAVYFNKTINKKDFHKAKPKLEKIIKKSYGFNVLLSTNQSNKFSMYKSFMFMPVSICLWMVYVNNWVSYLTIGLVISAVFLFGMVVNSIYSEYSETAE